MAAVLPLKLPIGVTEKDVKAMLRYDFGRTHWAAIVVMGDGSFDLYISQGGHCQPAGSFHSSKAILKFIREKAQTRFKDYEPVIDTLSRLKGRSAFSRIPECYDKVNGDDLERVGGKGKDECVACPFRHDCGFPTPEEIGLTMAEEELPEESEADLMKRVQAKMKKMYGDDDED